MSDTPKKWADRGWSFHMGDVSWEDYGGTWVRHLRDGRYLFIVFTNMEDAMGRDHDPASLYEASIRLVDLEELEAEKILEACRGLEGVEFGPLRECPIRAGEMLMYGTYARLTEDIYGSEEDGADAVLERAFEVTEEFCVTTMEFGGETYAVQDGMPVPLEHMQGRADAAIEAVLGQQSNAIGSTWLDNMRGDPLAALHEDAGEVIGGGKARSPENALMLKMYGASRGRTIGGSEPYLGMAGMIQIFRGLEHDDECNLCQCGTVEVVDGYVKCRGECGHTEPVNG